MMQKHQSATIMNNNSILRRVSQFEQQQNHGNDGVGFAGSNNIQQPQQSQRQQSLNSEKDLTTIQTAAALAAVNNRHNNHHNSNSPTTTVPSLSQSSSSSSLLLPNNEEQSATTAASSNENNSFIIAAFERFKQEFASLYPDHSGLPFDEQLHSVEQAKHFLQLQKERIKELNKQLNQTKFATKFLEEIIAHDDKESSSSGSILFKDIEKDSKNENNETNDKLNHSNNDSMVSSTSATTPSKEQYVTVITLNDSAYGEIQKISPSTTTKTNKQQPPPPSRSSSIVENNKFNKNHKDTDDDSDDDIDDKSDGVDLNNKKELINKMNKNKEDNKKFTSSSKPEPIYSNTLETQQKPNNTAQEKASKKRPPTPPRKPKLPNKLNNNVDNNNSSSFVGIPLTKSESYSNSSRSQCQRKFNGPLQQVGIQEKQMQSKSMKDVSASPSKPFLRTFSLEPNNKAQQPQDNQIDKKSLDESIISNDDNIYDTVAPDSDDEFQQQQQQLIINNNSNDEENETSSQEMLSRSSSTDELSNYVNIDYFLRKNSLGRSNSNIPAKLNCKNKNSNINVEESDDNEANMSSIKSSDCDNQFGSSDNILRSFQNAPSQHSIRSFNSISSTNSSGGSSLRIRNTKMLNNAVETYHHHHHPAPNLSTFTPPIREKNHQEFIFKDQSSIDEKDESSIYSDGSDFNLLESSTNNINNSLKNTSTLMMDSKSLSSDYNLELSSSTDYYAYADIYDASNIMLNVSKDDNNQQSQKMPSLDIQDESICMEDKSICKYDTSNLDNTDHIDGQQSQIGNNKKLISNIKAQQSSMESEHSQQMQWNIVRSIIDSETIYLDCLNTLNKYKKAFETASKGENALLSMEDLNTIFYRIPELFDLHNTFLNGLKTVEHGFKLRHSSMTADSKLASKLITKQSIGELFNKLAEKLSVYSDFLRNYSKAIETANRCGANNARFYDIIKSIKIASAHGQFSNLVDLLHEPVARLQKNDLVLHDLLKYSENEDEQILLKNASRLNQKFLNDLNLDAARKLFMTHDKFKRRLVKESFIIESGDRRKLRHLFLFNDVIVSAKYKASSKQKFTFELRWFQMLNDIVLDSSTCNQLNLNCSQSSVSSSIGVGGYISVCPPQQNSNTMNSQMINSRESDKESKECQNTANLISSLKSRAFLTRIDLFLEEKRKGHSKQSDRLRKKISELESELLLLLPQLRFSFHVKNNPHKSYVFFMSSEYERNCWIDAIKTLQQNASSDEHANVQVLQKWIESCRKSINVNLGSFLLRTNKDETLRYGDLHIRIIHLDNFNFQTNLFIVIETDSFGHYFKRAVARYLTTDSNNKHQDFLIELEGSQILRFLLYEDCKNNNKTGCDNPNENDKSLILKGKASLELSSSCASSEPRLTEIQLGEHMLCFETRYISWNSIMEMIPPNKIYGAFGVNIGQVCKKEKSKVPYLILSCINEVERRGLKEVGIYRVSGLSSEVQKLRKAFETNPREACYLIREIDIHSVTGLLKLYLRELPESLFTNEMLKKFFEARDLKNHEEKELKMTTLLSQLIEPNQTTVIKMIEHLVLVNRYEEDNKMSLNNLATVFGPTMLRTPSSNNSNSGGKSNSISSSSSSSGNNNNSSVQNFQSGNINANIASLMINTDLFTAGTIDVMAQADILYFFLRRKSDGLSLIAVDHQEETSL